MRSAKGTEIEGWPNEICTSKGLVGRRQGLLGRPIAHKVGGGGILARGTAVAISYQRSTGRVRFCELQAIRGDVYEEEKMSDWSPRMF